MRLGSVTINVIQKAIPILHIDGLKPVQLQPLDQRRIVGFTSGSPKVDVIIQQCPQRNMNVERAAAMLTLTAIHVRAAVSTISTWRGSLKRLHDK